VGQVQSRMNSSDSLQVNMVMAENALIENKKKTYSSMLQSLLDNLNAMIERYVKNNKLDAVYIFKNIDGQLAYVDKRKIITDAILALITQ
jgi:hypothetical protein